MNNKSSSALEAAAIKAWSILRAPDIAFPNLGIEIQRLNSVAFNVPFVNLDVMWYGVFISLGILLGALVAFRNTKRNGLTIEQFLDFVIIAVPVSLIFTRLYYVVFNLDMYVGNWMRIFTTRDGMGVYGGIISAFATLFVYSHIKSKKTKQYPRGEMMGRIGDTGVFGLLIGQMVGRLGNFFNQEAFGGFTNNLFAMQLRLESISREFGARPLNYLQNLAEENIRGNVTYEMLQNAYNVGADVVVTVHPTFLYEIMLNAAIFIFLWVYRGHKKFYGELLLMYAALYAFGRFFIERLRTDQLLLWGTEIPASMLVSALLFLSAVSLIVFLRLKKAKEPKSV